MCPRRKGREGREGREGRGWKGRGGRRGDGRRGGNGRGGRREGEGGGEDAEVLPVCKERGSVRLTVIYSLDNGANEREKNQIHGKIPGFKHKMLLCYSSAVGF